MRHAQGVGCEGWPACYGRIAGDAQQASAPPIGIHIARLLHRLAASGALLAILTLIVVSRSRSDLRRSRLLAIGALAVALALAALGIATPGATLPAVALGNLLGGFLMIALLAALSSSLVNGASGVLAPGPGTARAIGLTLLAALFAQTLAGGLIGTQYALPACATIDHCAVTGDLVSALHPFRQPIVVDGRVVPPAGASDLHVLHRALGVAIAAALLALAYVVRRTTPLGSPMLAGLAVASPLTGALALLHMPAPLVTVAHNALAASTVAALAWWMLPAPRR